MAQVFAPPASIEATAPKFEDYRVDGKFSFERMEEVEGQWLDSLRAWCKNHTDSKSALVGEVIRIQYADGFAQYMVFRTRPLQLIHIPLGDGWDLPEYQTRGIRVSDIQNMVDRDRKLAELFAKKREERKE